MRFRYRPFTVSSSFQTHKMSLRLLSFCMHGIDFRIIVVSGRSMSGAILYGCRNKPSDQSLSYWFVSVLHTDPRSHPCPELIGLKQFVWGDSIVTRLSLARTFFVKVMTCCCCTTTSFFLSWRLWSRQQSRRFSKLLKHLYL